MRRKLIVEVKGPDAARVKALSRRPRRAKYALGALVREPHGDVGAIDAIYADLQAAEEAGVIEDAAEWLAEQERRPRTSSAGIWYSVVLGSGNALVGERDLAIAKPKAQGRKAAGMRLRGR